MSRLQINVIKKVGKAIMNAVVYERFGGPEVLRLEDIAKPVPREDELLIKVRATSLNKADIVVLTGKPVIARFMGNGMFRPKHKVMGTDFSGVVETVGKRITMYQPGDEVFGDLSGSGFGEFGEYVCVTADVISRKPENLSFEEAATLPLSGCTALKSVRDIVPIKPNDTILVNGASGCVGIYVVQLLKSYAASITGICSTDKVDMVKKMGVDNVIDYKKEDFTRNGKKYELIIDAALYRHINEYKNSLTDTGTHIVIGGKTSRLFQAMFLSPFISRSNGKKLKTINSRANSEALFDLANFVKKGTLRPIIDRTYKLEDVREAMTYFMSKKARGKVVITI